MPSRIRKPRPRRVKGLPGVRLPLPKKSHQVHADRRKKKRPKHRKEAWEG
jgi:hypothetical protein